MTAQELFEAMGNLGANPFTWMAMDSVYVCPSRLWLTDVFSKAFYHNLQALGLSTWEPEVWDCDKFARLAWGMAAIMHARTQEHPTGALAFGLFLYKPATMNGRGHGINIVLTPEPLFYEPQKQLIVELSEKEIRSCYGVII